ncbi:MAG: DUF3568 family protein [Desulfobacteraceae bacterium]
MNYKQSIVTPVIIVFFLTSMGCTAAWVAGGAAAGIGTYKYIKGELESTEKVSLDKAYQATQTAMEDLEFTITSKQKDAFDGEVIARRATGKKVTVKLKRQSDSVTQIKIRVGTFGDETISKDILDTMKKYF